MAWLVVPAYAWEAASPALVEAFGLPAVASQKASRVDQLVWAIWLASDVKQVRVRYHKVKGHSDSEGNILVDYLAQVASRNGFYRCQELLK